MLNRCLRLVGLSIALYSFSLSVSAQVQERSPLLGDFSGKAGTLLVRIHINVDTGGTLRCALDSPEQAAYDLPCTDIKLDGKDVSFALANLRIKWHGTVEDDGAKLVGTWTQGSSGPLTFTRDLFVAARSPSSVDGYWLGALAANTDQAQRIQIEVKSDATSKEYCSLDSLDQRSFGLTCANTEYSGKDFSFDVPTLRGRFRGALTTDGNSLVGTWSQDGEQLPLTFERQASRTRPTPLKPPKSDAAIAPVSAEQMQAVLTNDLEKVLAAGALAPDSHAGIVVGVIRNGVRKVFTFGTANADSIFEIGSVSKTFTGLLLAQMIEQKKVKLDEPLRALLPTGTVAKPIAAEITLADLVTQHSGLPRLPDNFDFNAAPTSRPEYRVENMYQYLRSRGVARPIDTGFVYSNLGFGLLGQALSNRAKVNFEALLKQQILDPLCMRDTAIVLSDQQKLRFIQGYTPSHKLAAPWYVEAFAGAGAIRSTADDLLTYLQAQLDPNNKCKFKGDNGRTLSAAITQTHELRAEATSNMHIGFAWMHRDGSDTYWHNGATGGYTSYAFFNPTENYAAIVLFNTSPGARGNYADLLGRHIEQRFAGKPAISLAE